MAALDFYDPCYEILLCNPSLECDTIVEPEFCASIIQLERMVLCCHCVGTLPDSPIEMNSHLKAPKGPYSIVLPICKVCIDSGCRIIVCFARRNASAKQARLDAKHAREVLRQEKALGEDSPNGVSSAGVVDEEAQATGVAEEQHDTRSPRRSRRNTCTSSPSYCFVYFTHGV